MGGLPVGPSSVSVAPVARRIAVTATQRWTAGRRRGHRQGDDTAKPVWAGGVADSGAIGEAQDTVAHRHKTQAEQKKMMGGRATLHKWSARRPHVGGAHGENRDKAKING